MWPLFSILFSVFLLCLCIVRKPAVFDFITCLSFCKEPIVAISLQFWKCIKLAKEVKQLADITYFPLENVNKHNFFEILSPPSILIVPRFPRQYYRPMIKSSMSKCCDFKFVAINWFLKG